MIPAIVLAAGLATRLRPLSSQLAKAAMPIAGRTIIERIIHQLAGAGITDAVLNLHHLAHTVTALTGNGAHLGVRLRYSWEPGLLGSGGGPCRALQLIEGQRALIVNGDTLTDLDIPALVQSHGASGALVTLAVTPNVQPHRYGGIKAGPDGSMCGIVPRGSSDPSWHFVGVQVAERAAYESVRSDRPSESVSGVYLDLAKQHPGMVRIEPVATSFVDIGTPGDYLRTSVAIAAGDNGTTFGARVRVAPTASVVGSVLWDEVVVEAGAHLDGCVVMSGVCVPAGTRWLHSVLQASLVGIVATPLT
jgi:mannose-1-phosphate guanylyltransferase